MGVEYCNVLKRSSVETCKGWRKLNTLIRLVDVTDIRVWEGMGGFGRVRDSMGGYGTVWDGMGGFGSVRGRYGMVRNRISQKIPKPTRGVN